MIGPNVAWIAVDPKQHAVHWDGSVYMLAVEVKNDKTGKTWWEIDRVHVDADEHMHLKFECGCPYDAWSFNDATYFALVSGTMPEPEQLPPRQVLK